MTGSTTAKSHLDAALVEKAVAALMKFHNSTLDEKKSLLGSDVPVQVQFGLEVAPGRSQPKPMRLLIPHPVHEIENAEVCLIVKEESKESVQEMIEAFPEHMRCIKKVLGLQSLRNKHAEYQQRRLLLAKYDVFMADDRILPMLTKALGKDFLKAKKQPIAVRISRRGALPLAIRNALSSTYMTIPEGTCITVKVGNTSMKVEQLVENVVKIAEVAVPKIPRRWANIRCIGVKLPDSTSLPIYNKTPEQLLEIAKMAGLSSAWKTEEEEEAAAASEKKRQLEEEEEEETTAKDERKRKTKSPLLNALKKQKEIKSNGDEKDTKTKTRKESDEKKKKKSIGDEKKVTKEKAHKESDEKRSKKKKSKQSQESPGKKRKQLKDENLSSETERNRKSKKTNKVDDDDTPPVKKQKQDSSNKTDSTFITSKRFKGSKKGYVFKNGAHGVGYYIDVPPIVDKMAMDAIARMQSRPKSGRKSESRRRKGR